MNLKNYVQITKIIYNIKAYEQNNGKNRFERQKNSL